MATKKAQSSKDKATAQSDSPQPAGGTQVSPASGEPMIVQDASGETVNVPLDPKTGAPKKK